MPVIALTTHPTRPLDQDIDAHIDDYVTRPCSLAVLLARIDAVIRRALPHRLAPAPVVDFGIRIDPDTRQIHGPAGTVTLTAKECDLLTALMRRQGGVVTRQNLMEEVWDVTWVGASRTLDVHIATLRGKLGASSGTTDTSTRIDTLRGTGYRLVPAEAPTLIDAATHTAALETTPE
ncbi:hypothetical protein GCM10022223_13770 [Kineosporia mesophila]|uniref:Sensory transduction protein RegX3 n=2 Tax=Kineosporia mesophila TaxID=566012 RepID=A0ABP6Z5Z3_9ACTN|nr:response regulator transcription factor [Kineosporia mesophila]